jgi:NAD(P)-dependent dehydrogenase (short-subunit alcohol dehydrogenase family)
MGTATTARAWSADDIPDQLGRTFVVTGANSGIGYEAALQLARRRGRVVLACRNQEKGRRAADALVAATPGASVEVRPLDLADLASVRAFAARFLETSDRLDGLVNNAGIMAVPRGLTADGFELQFGTNHLGHFALTGLLLPALLATASARVMTVSSGGHRPGRIRFDDLAGERRYGRWPAYFQSKLANLLFTYELQRRLEAGGHEVIAVAAHPGVARTELGKATPLQARLLTLGERFQQPASAGALPTLRAATDPDVRGGEYYGPAGFLETAGPPVRVGSSRASRDRDTARRLWDRSIELTDVDFAGL